MFYPSIIETTGRSSKAFDLPTKLLQDRIIYLGGEINADSANFIIMQLLWLNADDPDKEIKLYINSLGGSVYDGLGIIDIINTIDAKVNTLGIGICASMGSMLLAAGTGTRKATKNCRIMIHSIIAGTNGTFQDMEIDFTEFDHLQKKLLRYLTDYTKGKTSLETMKELTQRDNFMSPEKAKELGLIDDIV